MDSFSFPLYLYKQQQQQPLSTTTDVCVYIYILYTIYIYITCNNDIWSFQQKISTPHGNELIYFLAAHLIVADPARDMKILVPLVVWPASGPTSGPTTYQTHTGAIDVLYLTRQEVIVAEQDRNDMILLLD